MKARRVARTGDTYVLVVSKVGASFSCFEDPGRQIREMRSTCWVSSLGRLACWAVEHQEKKNAVGLG
jgi:hypothetical protein